MDKSKRKSKDRAKTRKPKQEPETVKEVDKKALPPTGSDDIIESW